MSLPATLEPGAYPVEIGVYEPRSGERLKLDSGDNRLLLSERVTAGMLIGFALVLAGSVLATGRSPEAVPEP